MGLQSKQNRGDEFSSIASGPRCQRYRRYSRHMPLFPRVLEMQQDMSHLSVHTYKCCIEAHWNGDLCPHHDLTPFPQAFPTPTPIPFLLPPHPPQHYFAKPPPFLIPESHIPIHMPPIMPIQPPNSHNIPPRKIMWLPNSSSNKSPHNNITILTYNILSDIYVNEDKYPNCPIWALSWDYRRQNLMREIMLYDADVLCLQEVQSDHYEDFFKPALQNMGYSAVYKKKTREIYTGNGYTIDGCAIFFRSNKFKMINSYEIEYRKSALSLLKKLKPNQTDQGVARLIKHNVALAVVLEIEDIATNNVVSSTRFCVVNTHIYAGRGRSEVPLFQVSNLINEIEETFDPQMPLFICGDMNSQPGSDPYNLLTKHEVDPVFANVPDPLGIYKHLKLRHSMKLASAYASASESGEPFFTNVTPSHKYTLDYIFYTEDSIEVEGFLKLPNKGSVGKALPSPVWSSDHIGLMASFRITRPFSVSKY